MFDDDDDDDITAMEMKRPQTRSSMWKFLIQSLPPLYLGAAMVTEQVLLFFLGSLSYQWTELSLYKGQEQPDL